MPTRIVTSAKNFYYLYEWRKHMVNPNAEQVISTDNRFGSAATNSIATEIALFAFYRRDEQDQNAERNSVRDYIQEREKQDRQNVSLENRRAVAVIVPDIDYEKMTSRAVELGTRVDIYTEYLVNTTLEGLIEFYEGKPMDYIGPDIQNEFAEYRKQLESRKDTMVDKADMSGSHDVGI